MRNDIRHGGMIFRMPVGDEEKIALLGDGECGFAVGDVPWNAVIGR